MVEMSAGSVESAESSIGDIRSGIQAARGPYRQSGALNSASFVCGERLRTVLSLPPGVAGPVVEPLFRPLAGSLLLLLEMAVSPPLAWIAPFGSSELWSV